jgi:Tol biopolymer transport system component
MRRLYSLACVAGACIVLIASLTACDDGPFGPTFPSGTADGDDGRELLLKVPGYDCWGGVLSPEGDKFLFNMMSLEDYETDMCVLDLATGEWETFLEEGYPGDWSPDGEWIAYSILAGLGDIWLIRPDGTDNHPLVTSPMPDNCPSFSPDSSEVGFQGYLDYLELPDDQLYVIDTAGGEPRRITNSDGTIHYLAPRWSPDGEWFAFIDEVYLEGSDNEKTVGELYIISADGADEHRLVPQHPVWRIHRLCGWTPDGRAVILSMGETGKSRIELWLYYVKENVFEQLTYSNSTEIFVDGCDWGPNGKIVMTVYESDVGPKETNNSLWTMDAPY